MNNKFLTLVFPYYNSSNMIPIQVEYWNSYSQSSKDRIKIIVVDDGSTESQKLTKHLDINNVNVEIELYEILDHIDWNECGANNLGIAMADTPWVFRCDIDYLIPPHVLDTVLTMNPSEEYVYTFMMKFWDGPNQPTAPENTKCGPNIFLVKKNIFWKVGGYDEDFAGIYGSDMIFRWKLHQVAKEKVLSHLFLEAVYSGSTHELSRDATKAYELCEKKKSGAIPLSQDCLRFRWRRTL